MTLLLLCWEFFKTGLFAVGGGLATLPFLSEMSTAHPDWFTHAQLADMIAVAESTPGPIGINMATFAGFRAAGVPGAILATCSLVLPALIVLIIIGRALDKYINNKYVKRIFGGLRPAVTGLIAAAGWSVVKLSLLNLEGFDIARFWETFRLPAIGIFAVVLFLSLFKKTKKIHPIILIAACAAIGVVFRL